MSNIILDEKRWAEEALRSSGYLGGPMETLIRMAKYYMYLGQGKSAVKKSVEKFIATHGGDPTLVGSQEMISNAIRIAGRSSLFISDGVDITEPELSVIGSIDGIQAQRLAFTLLCLSKYLDQKRPTNNGWVSTPDNDIMKMANMKPPIKKQSELFARLEGEGLIRFSRKVDDLSVQVLFQQAGQIVLHISDFRNLGYQYMAIHHDGYYTCKNCGVTIHSESKKRGPKFKYCQECARKIAIAQRVNSVMRKRSAPVS